jgi:HEAT repeat protein
MENNYPVRRAAVQALGAIGSPRCIDLLIEAAGPRQVGCVRAEALKVLSKVGGSRGIEVLLLALNDPKLAGVAIEAVSETGDRRALQPLIDALSHPDKWVRRKAAYALRHYGEPSAVNALLSALGDKDPRVREAAAGTLGQIGDERATGSLVRLLTHRELDVRRTAVTALGRVGNGQAVPPLVALLGDASIKESARHAIEKLLSRCAAEFSIDDLKTVAGLTNYKRREEDPNLPQEGVYREVTVDVSAVVNLARQELDRRGYRGDLQAELRRREEERRLAKQREVMDLRQRSGKCVFCGKALSSWDKILGRQQHSSCNRYFGPTR